jgi:hypothetical protein
MDKNNILAAEHQTSALNFLQLNETVKSFLGKKIPKKLIKKIKTEIRTSKDVLISEHPKVVFNPWSQSGPAAVCTQRLKDEIKNNLKGLEKEIAKGNFMVASHYLWDLVEAHNSMGLHLETTPNYGRYGEYELSSYGRYGEYEKTWVTQVLKSNKFYNEVTASISHQLQDFKEAREEYWTLWTKYKNSLE